MSKIFLSSSISPHLFSIIAKTEIPTDKIKVAFISTAAEYETGDKPWLKESFQAFERHNLYIKDYTVAGKNYSQIKADLKEFNFFHLSGGNTFYLLDQIKKSGFDVFIKQKLTEGTVYSGESAGSVVAGPNIKPILKAEGKFDFIMDSYEGLNIVDFLVLPHWGSELFKDLYKEALDDIYFSNLKTVCLTEDQSIYINEGKIEFLIN